MTDHVQVLTTVGSEEDAERISVALVERRLAACVQTVGPIASRYRWRGEVAAATEWQCLAKTEAGRYAEVEAAIRELHPYELPAIHAVAMQRVFAPYAAWVGSNSSGG